MGLEAKKNQGEEGTTDIKYQNMKFQSSLLSVVLTYYSAIQRTLNLRSHFVVETYNMC